MSLNLNEIKITTIAGPAFVSIILNWGLFGIQSLQVYLYFQAFPKDRAMLKILVCVVYFLEMIQTFLLTDTAWNLLVSGFGNVEALDDIGTSWLSIPLIGGFIGFIVQGFYVYRIAVISRKWILPGSIISMSLTSFSGAVVGAINAKQAGKFSILVGHDKLRTSMSIGIWTGTGTVCDIAIAICMCYYLRRGNQYGRFSRTEAIVSNLFQMTIETGALTATISILSLALYYPPGLRDLTYYEVPLCVHAKMYSTTMLAVLNNRMKLEIASQSPTWRDTELAVLPGWHSRNRNRVEFYGTSTDGPLQSTTIHVTKEEVITTDDPKVHYIAPSVH